MLIFQTPLQNIVLTEQNFWSSARELNIQFELGTFFNLRISWYDSNAASFWKDMKILVNFILEYNYSYLSWSCGLSLVLSMAFYYITSVGIAATVLPFWSNLRCWETETTTFIIRRDRRSWTELSDIFISGWPNYNFCSSAFVSYQLKNLEN